MAEHIVEAGTGAIDLVPIRKPGLGEWLASAPERVGVWVRASGFAAEAGAVCPVPDEKGGLASVLVGLGDEEDPWSFAALPSKLPAGAYRLAQGMAMPAANWAALGWTLATYAFGRYKSRDGRDWPKLVWPEAADRPQVERLAAAITLVRDLINTPAADMGPAELAAAAAELAARHSASVRVVGGEGLLAEGYHCIHAVGRAAAPHRQPRLVDLVWGDPDAPKVTVVGKGVCFDSGGLDIKPSANMKLMKKDMGGAAHALGLASLIMDSGLPVRLRVLVPAVENAVSGDAIRPLDVLRTKKGITVEIGNTDAEGRLILADALAEAATETPAMLIDVATLTGAARAALGTDLPALFCNDEALAADILGAGEAEADPMWRLPLFKPYRRMLDSKVADIASVSEGSYAGAITAALFLQEFVPAGIPWAHLDLMAWNTAGRPGRPEGGEAMALRALFSMMAKRFPRR
ncbi:MAG: leucyl aminopeptidase family protein [Magnetospirillum sp.]|nr:leucyl aminopeptidase family protein [Magnetospirillum sp.]